MGGTDSEELQAPKGPLGEAQQATSGQSSKTDRKADVTEGANGTIDGSTPQTRRKVASPAATRMCDFGAFSSAPEPAEFDSDGDYDHLRSKQIVEGEPESDGADAENSSTATGDANVIADESESRQANGITKASDDSDPDDDDNDAPPPPPPPPSQLDKAANPSAPSLPPPLSDSERSDDDNEPDSDDGSNAPPPPPPPSSGAAQATEPATESDEDADDALPPPPPPPPPPRADSPPNAFVSVVKTIFTLGLLSDSDDEDNKPKEQPVVPPTPKTPPPPPRKRTADGIVIPNKPPPPPRKKSDVGLPTSTTPQPTSTSASETGSSDTPQSVSDTVSSVSSSSTSDDTNALLYGPAAVPVPIPTKNRKPTYKSTNVPAEAIAAVSQQEGNAAGDDEEDDDDVPPPPAPPISSLDNTTLATSGPVCIDAIPAKHIPAEMSEESERKKATIQSGEVSTTLPETVVNPSDGNVENHESVLAAAAAVAAADAALDSEGDDDDVPPPPSIPGESKQFGGDDDAFQVIADDEVNEARQQVPDGTELYPVPAQNEGKTALELDEDDEDAPPPPPPNDQAQPDPTEELKAILPEVEAIEIELDSDPEEALEAVRTRQPARRHFSKEARAQVEAARARAIAAVNAEAGESSEPGDASARTSQVAIRSGSEALATPSLTASPSNEDLPTRLARRSRRSSIDDITIPVLLDPIAAREAQIRARAQSKAHHAHVLNAADSASSSSSSSSSSYASPASTPKTTLLSGGIPLLNDRHKQAPGPKPIAEDAPEIDPSMPPAATILQIMQRDLARISAESAAKIAALDARQAEIDRIRALGELDEEEVDAAIAAATAAAATQPSKAKKVGPTPVTKTPTAEEKEGVEDGEEEQVVEQKVDAVEVQTTESSGEEAEEANVAVSSISTSMTTLPPANEAPTETENVTEVESGRSIDVAPSTVITSEPEESAVIESSIAAKETPVSDNTVSTSVPTAVPTSDDVVEAKEEVVVIEIVPTAATTIDTPATSTSPAFATKEVERPADNVEVAKEESIAKEDVSRQVTVSGKDDVPTVEASVPVTTLASSAPVTEETTVAATEITDLKQTAPQADPSAQVPEKGIEVKQVEEEEEEDVPPPPSISSLAESAPATVATVATVAAAAPASTTPSVDVVEAPEQATKEEESKPTVLEAESVGSTTATITTTEQTSTTPAIAVDAPTVAASTPETESDVAVVPSPVRSRASISIAESLTSRLLKDSINEVAATRYNDAQDAREDARAAGYGTESDDDIPAPPSHFTQTYATEDTAPAAVSVSSATPSSSLSSSTPSSVAIQEPEAVSAAPSSSAATTTTETKPGVVDVEVKPEEIKPVLDEVTPAPSITSEEKSVTIASSSSSSSETTSDSPVETKPTEATVASVAPVITSTSDTVEESVTIAAPTSKQQDADQGVEDEEEDVPPPSQIVENAPVTIVSVDSAATVATVATEPKESTEEPVEVAASLPPVKVDDAKTESVTEATSSPTSETAQTPNSAAEEEDVVPEVLPEDATPIQRMQARERYLVRKSSMASTGDASRMALETELASLRQLLAEHEQRIKEHEAEKAKMKQQQEEIDRMRMEAEKAKAEAEELARQRERKAEANKKWSAAAAMAKKLAEEKLRMIEEERRKEEEEKKRQEEAAAAAAAKKERMQKRLSTIAPPPTLVAEPVVEEEEEFECQRCIQIGRAQPHMNDGGACCKYCFAEASSDYKSTLYHQNGEHHQCSATFPQSEVEILERAGLHDEIPFLQAEWLHSHAEYHRLHPKAASKGLCPAGDHSLCQPDFYLGCTTEEHLARTQLEEHNKDVHDNCPDDFPYLMMRDQDGVPFDEDQVRLVRAMWKHSHDRHELCADFHTDDYPEFDCTPEQAQADQERYWAEMGDGYAQDGDAGVDEVALGAGDEQ